MMDNKIKSSAEKITMPNEVKTRIISKCEELETSMNKTSDNGEFTDHVFTVERVKGRNILRTVSAVAACAVLVGGIGATGIYMNKQGRPHPSKGIIDEATSAEETAAKSAVTTEVVTSNAKVTKKATTTESITTSKTEVTTTAVTAVKTEFSRDNILKYIKIPDENALSEVYYCYPVFAMDENGNSVMASVVDNHMNRNAVEDFVTFMTVSDITEAKKQQSDKELAALLDFSVILPYTENISSTFEVYQNGICCMQVAENEVKGTGRENRVLEEYFFNIDNDALKFAIESTFHEHGYYGLDGEEYTDEIDNHFSQKSEVHKTYPTFAYGDILKVNVFAEDDERIDDVYSLDEDESDKIYSYMLINFSWLKHDISENKEEMAAFENDKSVKLEYMINARDDVDHFLCDMFIYSGGYVQWYAYHGDDCSTYTYKFDNSEMSEKFDEIFKRENVLDYLDAMSE